MNLYMVTCTDENGDNKDLLVAADDANEAVGFWRFYYELSISEWPDHTFYVPWPKKKGAIAWHKDAVEVIAREQAIDMAKQALGVSDD